jgi:hypothetical protein
MRIEFRRPEAPDVVVARARWDGKHALIDAADDDTRDAVQHMFRPAPVATEDPSYRPPGTRGGRLIQPGSLEWFVAAAFARAREADLIARAVPDVPRGAGWDPAGQYRTFREQVTRLESGTS